MKHISANKLNRLWQNGILPGLAKKLEITKVLKTQEQVEANTNPDNVASAVVVGEVINNLGGYSFGETADGKPGYRKPGADTVIPFNSNDLCWFTGNNSVFNKTNKDGSNFSLKNNAVVCNKSGEYNIILIGYFYNASDFGRTFLYLKENGNILITANATCYYGTGNVVHIGKVNLTNGNVLTYTQSTNVAAITKIDMLLF